MISSLKLAAVVALVAGSVAAQATTITFDSLATSNEDASFDTYSEGGLQFGTASGRTGGLLVWGNSSGANADPSGATLLENWISDSLLVTAVGGGTFTLNSFDLADGYNQGSPGNIAFTWVDASGSHTEDLALAGNPGLKTFDLGLANITSFSLLQASPYFQLDNVVINSPSAVPEPANVGLMLAGLAAIGVVARRRKA